MTAVFSLIVSVISLFFAFWSNKNSRDANKIAEEANAKSDKANGIAEEANKISSQLLAEQQKANRLSEAQLSMQQWQEHERKTNPLTARGGFSSGAPR